MDPQLHYYYHTSTHRRFYEGELPSFNEPPQNKQEKRVARRELLTGNIGGRATLAGADLGILIGGFFFRECISNNHLTIFFILRPHKQN